MTEYIEYESSAAQPAIQRLFSRESEEAVLGAVIINPSAYYDLAEFIRAEYFYLTQHRWIWQAFQTLNDNRKEIDLVNLTQELDNAGHLEEIGGPAYVTKLIDSVPFSTHAVDYGKTVESYAIRRKLVDAASKIVKIANRGDVAIDHVIDGAEKEIFGVSEDRSTRDLETISQAVSSYYDKVSDISRREGELFGVPTGFFDLDRLLGALQPSDLLIVAGRPGMGKTGFLLTVAKHAAQTHGKHVAIFSLEMSNEQLVQRLISQETGIDSKKLRTADLDPDEWTLLTQASESLQGTRIFLDDTPGITPLQLRAKCRRLHAEHRIDLVVVDYLQLMSGDSRTENRVQEVSFISRNLKNLARELKVPVLTAAQLSRAVEQRADKRPILSDLRESGSLEQDADVVMFIYRPDVYVDDPEKKNTAEIIVAKHRNGPTGSINLVFLDKLAKFENAYTRRPV